MKEQLARLHNLDTEIRILEQSTALLNWDQETYMPPKGIDDRSKQVSLLQRISHEKRTSPEIGRLLEEIEGKNQISLSEIETAFIKNMKRRYQRDVKIPVDLVARFAEAASLSQSAWAEARKESNYAKFVPHLQKVIDLSLEKAQAIGYEKTPYDALLDEFEPWTTTTEIQQIFTELKKYLAKLVKQISQARPINDDFLYLSYPIEKQKEFEQIVLKDLGFDFERGRLDTSGHPFTISVGSDDVRITTRYGEKAFKTAIFGTIHECGHALYEAGFDKAIRNTMLANGISCGIHESQSRMMENLIGRSYAFWEHYFGKLKDLFPDQLRNISLDQFYQAVNKVTPSFIRVEADEVTYNLHIALRFELEQQLLEGRLTLKDLPEAWNSLTKELLGIVPENDSLGVLQDVHWSIGIFGYFPTYSLGNLYSAQFFSRMKQDLPDLEKNHSTGNFSHTLNWLRQNIHRHGLVYSATDLCRKITGSALQTESYMNYLTAKYSEIYQL